jgi:uracil-DNA glycosylase
VFEEMHPAWQALLEDKRELLTQILVRYSEDPNAIPARQNLLRAFDYPPEHYRVLILGQDPYPNPEHAIGLAFAVPEGTLPLPPTLGNIFKELRNDLGVSIVKTADISVWARRGVMLLNRHLSTSANNSAAHLNFGWGEFTEAAVAALCRVRGEKLVAILWGQKAQELAGVLKDARVISSAHPSPLSSYRGFFGSKPFSACNKLLLELGEPEIDWSC